MLKDFGVADFDKEVVTHLERNTALAELLSDEVMAIQANRDREGGIAADADGVAHAELRILDEEVIMIHPPATSSDLAFTSRIVFGSIRDKRGGFLLDFDDAVDGLFLIRNPGKKGGSLVDVTVAGLG